MASKRVKLVDQFLDLEAQENEDVSASDREDENMDGFIFDEEELEEDLTDGDFRSRPLEEPVTDEQLEIEEFVQRVRKRAQRMSNERASPGSLQLWMIPVSASMASLLADSLMSIHKRSLSPSEFRTYFLPSLPGRIYVKVSGLEELAQIMRFSAFNRLLSRASRVDNLEGINDKFLEGSQDRPSFEEGQWVRVLSRGLYYKDIGLVIKVLDDIDLCEVAVVPRFDQASYKWRLRLKQQAESEGFEEHPSVKEQPRYNRPRAGKRKAGRLSAALLEKEILDSLPVKKGYAAHRRRRFHQSGMEVLKVPSIHSLAPETDSPEEDVLKMFELSGINPTAVRNAYYNIVRRSWHPDDRVLVTCGAFIDTQGYITEIDSSNHCAVLHPISNESTSQILVEAPLSEMRRLFSVGDLVRVAVGLDKGRIGTIVSINKDIVNIIEKGMQPDSFGVDTVMQFQSLYGYLELYTSQPSYQGTRHPLAPGISGVRACVNKLPTGVITPDHESDLGSEALVYRGHMKGRQGRLLEIGRESAKIECIGRQPPFLTVPRKYLIVLSRPDRNFAGTMLNRPFTGTALTWPTFPEVRPSTPLHPSRSPTPVDFNSNQTAGMTAHFLLDPMLINDSVKVFVRFEASYERGTMTKRNAWTEKERFHDSMGVCLDNEVSLTWTDHRGNSVTKRVGLQHLKPAPPSQKNEEVQILNGDWKGTIGRVQRIKRKELKAVVETSRGTETFSYTDLCLVTHDPSHRKK